MKNQIENLISVNNNLYIFLFNYCLYKVKIIRY